MSSIQQRYIVPYQSVLPRLSSKLLSIGLGLWASDSRRLAI